MIHTFNRNPQMPEVEHRRGIELSLAQNRERKASWHSTRKLSESRNRSLQMKNNSQLFVLNAQKSYSLEKKPDIKINFVNKNNGWVNPIINGLNVAQRFDKTLYPQQFLPATSIQRPMNDLRQNYHFVHPNQTPKIVESSKSRVIFGSPVNQQFPQQFHSTHKQSNTLNYTPILTDSILNQSTSQKPVQFMNKNGNLAQTSNLNLQKSYSSSNLTTQQSQPTYQPLLHQFRERRASSKQKGNTQKLISDQSKNYSIDHGNTSQYLQKNPSTPKLTKIQLA